MQSDPQKIQFAAGLKLKRRMSPPHQVLNVNMSTIEFAYQDRCRAVAAMLYTFKCACHNASFPTVKRLFAHLRTSYTWFPIFTCYNCVITFSSRSGSMRHTARCPKQFLENIARTADMDTRMESKIRNYQLCKCMKCSNLYGFYEDYLEHLDREHLVEPPYVCCCNREFSELEKYRQHINNSCFLNYYCDICYSTFENIDDFRKHCEMVHDNVDEYTFVTLHENFRLVSTAEMLASKRRKYVEVTNNIEDEKDSKKFVIPLRPKKEPLNCDECERRFSNTYNLKKHMKTHRKNYIKKKWKNKPTSCDKCGKMFSTYYNMIRHHKVHEESEKQFQCALCPETFPLVLELKEHLVSVHGRRTNVCQECGKQFNSVEELDAHRSAHLNFKVYRDSHTRAYHTIMKKNHVCDVCERAFESEGELQEHFQRHENVVKEEPVSIKSFDRISLVIRFIF